MDGHPLFFQVGTFPAREPTADEITELIPQAVAPIGGDDGSSGDASGDVSGGDSTGERAKDSGAPTSATDKFEPPTW